MESRDKIIDKIIDKTIKLLDDKEDFCLCKLSIYKNFFSEEEIEEYNKKIDIIEYLEKENDKKIFIEKNLEVLLFFIKDMKLFLLGLKNKKRKLLNEVFNEGINSLENFKKFHNFIFNDRIYLVHYNHYFTNKEIEEYKRIWNDLEEFTFITLNDEKVIDEYWKKNFSQIKLKILELLLFVKKIEF